MTWTYSGDPSDSPKDAIRFIVQDTDENNQLVQDEEINFLLDRNGQDIDLTATRIATTIARGFAQNADFVTPDLEVRYREQAKLYSDLADQLKEETSITNAVPYAGGISVSDIEAREADTDRKTPLFIRDQTPYNREGGDPP